MLKSPFRSAVLVLVLGLSSSVASLSCGGSPGAGDLGGGDATAPSDGAGADGQGSPVDATADGSDATGGGPTDASTDAGGGLRDVACTPGCPADVQCGLYVDCTGNTLVCGQPCAKGESCVAQGTSQTCQPTSTMCAGRCGDVAIDPCGVAVACGGCKADMDCVNHACVPQTITDAGHACGNLMCSAGTQSFCGTLTDGCGHTMPCTCPAGQQCYTGLCMAPPPECADTDAGAARCGTLPNACGSGNVQCGPCAGGGACVKNVCAPCAPPSCNGATCGEATNACGQKMSCGQCNTGDDCYQGSCCTPKTCAEVLDGGAATSCTPVDLGCGKKASCLPCGAGDVCMPNGSCCQPQTCADFPDAGCGTVDLGCGITKACNTCNSADECVNNSCVPCQAKTCANYPGGGCGLSDGCGHKLDCCQGETACQGGLCCPIGEVNYQGSCCQPQCDSTQPPGPQESCGQIILCSNN